MFVATWHETATDCGADQWVEQVRRTQFAACGTSHFKGRFAKRHFQVRILWDQPTTVVSLGHFPVAQNLTTLPQVSERSIGLCSTNFRVLSPCGRVFRGSLWSQKFNIRILMAETWFEATETGSKRQPAVFKRPFRMHPLDAKEE
jgi:hypothetical protein